MTRTTTATDHAGEQYAEQHEYEWVLAAPFRAHLRELIDDGGLPWQAVAVACGIPLRMTHTLLFGRHGRTLPKLPPRIARQLLRVSPRDLRSLDRRPGNPELAAQAAAVLHRRGMSVAEIALLSRSDRATIQDLLQGAAIGWFDARTELLLRAACAQRGERWAEPVDPWRPETDLELRAA
ncbi:hypothetical protein ACF3NT_01610 [Naumannella halotolerans]|uniref:Uncharacterized protein n=1 Tax=Naumannella halotolerans TaxID=993414 RepID=A0A4V3EN72_9ACTN|nr:hypothetical protein [Naumannella halotolerans]TDT32758.1 hypothetical protein CLV29_0346 [Naumannella halotolerans]